MTFIENSRFLFEKQPCKKLDISLALGTVDKKIIDSKKLNFKSSNIYLEFFNHPSSEDFQEGDVNIGRLITGYEQQVFEELAYKDYSSVKEDSFDVELGADWPLFFESLETSIPKNTVKWRLSISEDFSTSTVFFSIES